MAQFRAIHGDYYDYSSVEYVNSFTKVKVGCPGHGEFEITPGHHSKGVGRRKCYFESQKTSKEEFVTRAQHHFSNRYDYSLFDALPHFGEKVRIYCRTHEEVFWQEPRNHMRGHTGCPGCQSIKLAGPQDDRGTLKSDEELTLAFIKRARNVHGSAYYYTEFRYVTASAKGKIICPRHGAFWHAPSNHLRGSKCPVCARESRKVDTFKEKCKALGVDYWRALKRARLGFLKRRFSRKAMFGIPVTRTRSQFLALSIPIWKKQCGFCNRRASGRTIARWIKEGRSPEEAFAYIPNPGYANGIIYLIMHKAPGNSMLG